MSLRNYNLSERSFRKQKRKAEKSRHRKFMKEIKDFVASGDWDEVRKMTTQYEKDIQAIHGDYNT